MFEVQILRNQKWEYCESFDDEATAKSFKNEHQEASPRFAFRVVEVTDV